MEVETKVHVTCPKCGHEFDTETTVEVDPPEWDEL